MSFLILPGSAKNMKVSLPDKRIGSRRPSKRAIAAAAIIVAVMIAEPERKRSCWVKPRDKKRSQQSTSFLSS